MFVDVLVRCEECMAEGPLFDDEGGGNDIEALVRNLAAVAKHWNTRQPIAIKGHDAARQSSTKEAT